MFRLGDEIMIIDYKGDGNKDGEKAYFLYYNLTLTKKDAVNLDKILLKYKDIHTYPEAIEFLVRKGIYERCE